MKKRKAYKFFKTLIALKPHFSKHFLRLKECVSSKPMTRFLAHFQMQICNKILTINVVNVTIIFFAIALQFLKMLLVQVQSHVIATLRE